jgi:regulator of sirC expression with transglutaminase-like and TPR domain
MAADIQKRLPTQRYPLRVIQAINQYLYEDLGFRGNSADYYDPRNSFLNEVIERRTGIPITLSLIYLEIARRMDFPMVEVGMPGHFLIRPALPDMNIFVDPFYEGEILFQEDCQQRLAQIYGPEVQLQPAFFDPVGPRRFLARMLSNLKAIYLQQPDLQKALDAIERILLLFPDTPLELRDRGLLYYHFNRWTEARQDLEIYLAKIPDAEDRTVIRRLLEQISQGI